MKYFHYTAMECIVAPMLKLLVHDPVACQDQWCCDPHDVQIETVWFHVVPITSIFVGSNYEIVKSPWQGQYELKPFFGPLTPRYCKDMDDDDDDDESLA